MPTIVKWFKSRVRVFLLIPIYFFVSIGSTVVVAEGINSTSGNQSPVVLQLKTGEFLSTPASVTDTTYLLDKASSNGRIRIIVMLKTGKTTITADVAGLSSTQVDAISAAQKGFTSSLATTSAKIHREFNTIPGVALDVDQATLQAIINNPSVASVEEDVAVPPNLQDAIPLIDADNAHSSGYKGEGQVVAVLDTGSQTNHPFLSGKVVSGACYSSNGSGYSSLCPGGATSSTTIASSTNCNLNYSSGCAHGTHVAGIAVGKSGTSTSDGTIISGVAPLAKLIPIQVFTRFTTPSNCGAGVYSCVLSWSSDQISGLERVYALRNTYSIASVNMSIGGGTHTSTCDSNSLKAIIDNLRAAGIATVISSGNDGYGNATGAPGCISTAITVGATTKSDNEASYSNSASWVDLMAPGSAINSSVPISGYSGNTWNGTSMAAPVIAGAWAVMKSKYGTATVSSIESKLESTGKSVWSYNAGYKPRVDLDNALAALSAGPRMGLNWVRVQQAYHYTENGYTWVYVEQWQRWVAINDDKSEKIFINAASSYHWLGIEVSSIAGNGSFTISSVRLWRS